MSPCIKLYNDKCHGDANPTEFWNRLNDQMDLDKFLCYDANILESIALIMKRNVDNGASFIPIEEHQQIVDRLKTDEEMKIDLVNIDFHHDIWYNRESINAIDMFGEYSCADWVGYLYQKNMLNSYTWVKMPNSEPYGASVIDKIDKDFQMTILRSRDILDLSSDFDEVYFCKSPQWVPYKYIHLYDLLVKIIGGEHT